MIIWLLAIIRKEIETKAAKLKDIINLKFLTRIITRRHPSKKVRIVILFPLSNIAIECDVTSSESAVKAVGEAKEANGIAQLLINCAGIATPGRIVNRNGPLPLEDYEAVIKVNLIGDQLDQIICDPRLLLAIVEFITINSVLLVPWILIPTSPPKLLAINILLIR